MSPSKEAPGFNRGEHVAYLALGVWLALCGSAWAQSFPAVTTNASIVITTGGTFQSFTPVPIGNATRHSLTIENNNASDSCWLFIGSGTASKAASILLTPGGAYTRYSPYVPSDTLKATCATTGDTVYVDVN